MLLTHGKVAWPKLGSSRWRISEGLVWNMWGDAWMLKPSSLDVISLIINHQQDAKVSALPLIDVKMKSLNEKLAIKR